MTSQTEDFMDIDDVTELAQISNQLAYARQKNPFQFQKSEEFYQKGRAFEPLPPSTTAVFILDTNFLISHLSTVSILRQLSRDWGHVLIIPWAVVQELDGLNKLHSGPTYANSKGLDVPTLARSAINWIANSLSQKDNSVRGQKMTEVIDTNLTCNDDAILDCCLYWAERSELPIWLLTSDTNLRVKAMIHSIGAINPLNLSAVEILGQAFNRICSSSVPSAMQVDTRSEFDMNPPLKSENAANSIYASKWASMEKDPPKGHSQSPALVSNSKSALQFPEPQTARDPALSALLHEISQTFATVSTPYLRHHAKNSLGGEVGASWIFRSTPNPKNFGDVVQIIIRSYFTIFSSLFPQRREDRNGQWILKLSESLDQWIRWADYGLGKQPNNLEMIAWLNEVWALWQGLASGLEDSESRRIHEEKVITWQQNLEKLSKIEQC